MRKSFMILNEIYESSFKLEAQVLLFVWICILISWIEHSQFFVSHDSSQQLRFGHAKEQHVENYRILKVEIGQNGKINGRLNDTRI